MKRQWTHVVALIWSVQVCAAPPPAQSFDGAASFKAATICTRTLLAYGGGEKAEIEGIPLPEAVKAGLAAVELTGDGTSTSHCRLRLTNLSGQGLKIRIPTYQAFVPNSPDFQIMSTTKPEIVDLPLTQTGASTTDVVLETICASRKSAKAPPTQGVSYCASNYPDTKLEKIVISVFERSKQLESTNCYARVPLPVDSRQHTIGQLAVWRVFSRITGSRSDEVSTASLKSELFSRADVTADKLTRQEMDLVDSKVCAMFSAVDFTVKQTKNIAPYVVANSKAGNRPSFNSGLLVIFSPAADGPQAPDSAQEPAPAAPIDQAQSGGPVKPTEESAAKPLEDWEEQLLKNLFDEIAEDQRSGPKAPRDPADLSYLLELPPNEIDEALNALQKSFEKMEAIVRAEENSRKSGPSAFAEWKSAYLHGLHTREKSFDEEMQRVEKKVRDLLRQIREAGEKSTSNDKNPLRKLRGEAKRWMTASAELYLQKWDLQDEIHRVENLK